MSLSLPWLLFSSLTCSKITVIISALRIHSRTLATYLCTFIACVLLWWLSGKKPTWQCRRWGFDPWLGRSLGEGGGNLLQYSCLGNLMDRGDWWATDHGVRKVRHNWTTKQQCTHIWVMGTLLCVYVFVFALQKGRSDYRFCSVTCNFQFTSWRSFIYSLFFLTAVYSLVWQTKVDSALLSLMHRYVISSSLLLSYPLELANFF